MGWSAEDIASMPQHTGEGEISAAASNTFLVHVTDRKQAEARLRGVGDVGAYLLRAKSQQEISSGTVAMSYVAIGSTIIHHKFVAQVRCTTMTCCPCL